MLNGEPWWILADVCKVLEMGSPHKVANRLDEDEKGRTTIPTHGGPQEFAIINESGLYSIILKSRKPSAKRFKKWVTSEVLPAIRKTGGYMVAPLIWTPSPAEYVPEACDWPVQWPSALYQPKTPEQEGHHVAAEQRLHDSLYLP
ncbi:Bro-N domain-containing protein [Acetobacter tropicalis]|nr:Bro-N domain-containing protein [Acetobacter tropicalis]KAA8392119.1 Bro-N domain-containing protein [Acetobacter tropicalis]MBC9008074.1 Bro-N domain-containing protein [Acetobacter tropicalis]MCG4272986.1 Bro-N domain-containing protein [Acetobacter senegalensis]